MASSSSLLRATLLAAPLLFTAGAACAQDDAEITMRMDRLESAIRQLTGNIEQLQYRNQQLEQQLRRMQDDYEYRFQQMGSRGSGAAAPARQPAPMNAPASNAPMQQPPMQAPPSPGRRGDAFDPSQSPNAPGAPRALGGGGGIAAAEPPPYEPPVGAPGGRAAGAPLDLSTMASTGDEPPQQQGMRGPPGAMPPPARGNPAGMQASVAPPSDTPKDEYDLAYGYVLRKDYALAEQTFRTFLKKYPSDRLAPEAQYWLAESLFQRQEYRPAADSFLVVVRNYEKSAKAPEALLRLGQSLGALNQKEMACASLAEVGRKYPRASAGVKRSVEQEQKRAHC